MTQPAFIRAPAPASAWTHALVHAPRRVADSLTTTASIDRAIKAMNGGSGFAMGHESVDLCNK